ncbi:hypothetical protein VSR68_30545 [Paraburkholderia phymatum]|uniref:hypothetical protein n=1 Tax=Paraburkholderia phymatum TaxID=148447 RepID=UPI00317E9BAB
MASVRAPQQRFVFQDEADAIAYWADKEFKKWAIDVTAGPEKHPTYSRTFYACARTSGRAIECVRRDMLHKPAGARFRARLAGPRELGCVKVEGSDVVTGESEL